MVGEQFVFWNLLLKDMVGLASLMEPSQNPKLFDASTT